MNKSSTCLGIYLRWEDPNVGKEGMKFFETLPLHEACINILISFWQHLPRKNVSLLFFLLFSVFKFFRKTKHTKQNKIKENKYFPLPLLLLSFFTDSFLWFFVETFSGMNERINGRKENDTLDIRSCKRNEHAIFSLARTLCFQANLLTWVEKKLLQP